MTESRGMVSFEDVGILEKLVRDREGHAEKQEEDQGHAFNGAKDEENTKERRGKVLIEVILRNRESYFIPFKVII